MVPIVVGSILTVALGGLIWGISTQIRDAFKSARVKQRGNFLKAKMSSSEETKQLAEIDDLKRQPEIEAAKQGISLDNQANNVNQARLDAYEIHLKRDKLATTAGILEKSRVININFVPTEAGIRAKKRLRRINIALRTRRKLIAARKDTAKIDDYLRRHVTSGHVIEQYEIRNSSKFTGVHLNALNRFVTEGNRLNSFVEDALREALEIRPGKVARATIEHGSTQPDSTSVLPHAFLAELGSGRNIYTTVQKASTQASAISTAPAAGTPSNPRTRGRATGS